MKVNLVVIASGPNNGRVIPVAGAKFVIGRDPSCQLRPASPSISKQHCAFHIRDGKVWLEDFGSTNGTTVNDEPVPRGERQATDGDRIRVGPLEFRLQIVPTPTPADGTPLPNKLEKLADVIPGATKPTPKPAAPKSNPGTAPAPPLKPVPVKRPVAAEEETVADVASTAHDGDENDDAARHAPGHRRRRPVRRSAERARREHGDGPAPSGRLRSPHPPAAPAEGGG